MNECISRLAAEFEKMEKTIEFQSKIIKAATAQKTVCPFGIDQSAFNLPRGIYSCRFEYQISVHRCLSLLDGSVYPYRNCNIYCACPYRG